MSSKKRRSDEEAILIALCELVKGATLLKAGRSGKPHFRHFRLTPDLSRIQWESAKKNDAAVKISEITEMKLGQTTPNFKRNPLPECENRSFSLLYSDRSLDIVCKDKREFDTWTTGIKALQDGFNDFNAVKDKMQQLNYTPGEDRLKVHFGTLKDTVLVKESACDLYTWGGGGRGRLGHKEDDKELLPRVVESLLGRNITLVACGGAHTITLSSKGEVFSWGAGTHGRLGHGNLRDRFSPLMVDTPLRGLDIVQIACYEYHSAVLSDDGELYTWGRAGPYLGYSVEEGKNQLTPRRVEALIHEKVVQVVCGRLHTLAATERGVVYSFGQNKFGELGLGHDSVVSTPTIIPDLTSINKLTCGRHHSAAIDEDGILWMWGWGARGQLGQGELKSSLSPISVEGFNDQPVMDVSCGWGHTGAITLSGIAYCWGDNSTGQVALPITTLTEVAKPRPVHTPSGSQPMQIACGANFTVIITGDGQMYTFGCGLNGQLGIGETRKYLSQLTEVEALKGKKVQFVACGEEHMACLVTHGWVPDEEANACMACKKNFTAVRRRHHCRNCGGIFCGSCSSKRFPLLDKGFADPVRVCDNCHNRLSAVTSD